MAGEVVSGVDTILKRLDALQKRGKTAVVRAAISGGLTVVVKQIKAEVDPKAKDARKSVKSRFKKGKTRVEALAGFGVGKRKPQTTKQKFASFEKKMKRQKRGKLGRGIGPHNIHWWVAGTKKRTTNRNTNRGRMPAMQPGLARNAYQKSRGKIQSEMSKRGALALEKEVLKLQSIR